ncbi:MAG: hypothetical protein ACK4V4_08690 [Sphingobacteriales bacterium]|jgi:hypothetical protein
MSKQSPKDPKFRCNICKEYFKAPEYTAHYQCPKHGYLCEKHVGQKGQRFYGHDARNKAANYKLSLYNSDIVKNEWNKDDPDSNPFFDVVTELPESLVGHCLCDPEKNVMEPFYTLLVFPSDSLEWQYEQRCKKKLVKFYWSINAQRWLEEGLDNEEDFIKKQNKKTGRNTSNTEIALLVELFERNILTKDQFLEQIKEKL